METQKRYNEQLIDLMEKLSNIMLKQGEQFRARAYQKAQETIMTVPNNIISTSQLKGDFHSLHFAFGDKLGLMSSLNI